MLYAFYNIIHMRVLDNQAKWPAIYAQSSFNHKSFMQLN